MNMQTWSDDMWPEAPYRSLQEMEDILNANFVSRIMLIAKEEEILRKELFVRLNLSYGDHLSKDNMKKVFLRSTAKAFSKLYGDG